MATSSKNVRLKGSAILKKALKLGLGNSLSVNFQVTNFV